MPSPLPPAHRAWTRRAWLRTVSAAGALATAPLLPLRLRAETGDTPDLGSRLELFVDSFLVERHDGTRLKLHEPHLAGPVLSFDRPWEGAFSGYVTALVHEGRYRLYYRGLPQAGADGSENEVTCCALSSNGRDWERPGLDLHPSHGHDLTNIILAGQAPFSHNFCPFVDLRPGVPPEETFKALAGTSQSGLVAFVSEDGLRWRRWRKTPVFTKGAFDSQNVAFWSEHEQRYLLYFRSWSGGEFAGFRTISRSTSPDFVSWSDPVRMTFGNTALEHLYTNQTHPYYRAPHLYLSFPMRFMPGRRVLTEAQAKALGVHGHYAGDCAETVFMTSRGGTVYDRTFMEGFIRPGLDPGNWASRAGLTGLGVLPTGPGEISLYKQAHYAQPSSQLLRYTLRTDGFASVNAPFDGGSFLTRPFRFAGRHLLLNFATGAAGDIRVEIQDAQGRPRPGFALSDAEELIGDDLARPASWRKGADVSALAGETIRLRCVMKDADLYAIQFRP